MFQTKVVVSENRFKNPWCKMLGFWFKFCIYEVFSRGIWFCIYFHPVGVVSFVSCLRFRRVVCFRQKLIFFAKWQEATNGDVICYIHSLTATVGARKVHKRVEGGKFTSQQQCQLPRPRSYLLAIVELFIARPAGHRATLVLPYMLKVILSYYQEKLWKTLQWCM